MSRLGKIAVQALQPASVALGPDDAAGWLTIGTGGERWRGTAAEARNDRDYIEGGQQMSVTQTFVGAREEFEELYTGTLQSYEGSTASLNGTAYRVAAIEWGEAFITVHLEGEEEAP